MKNYFETYEKYVQYMEDESQRKAVMSRFARLRLEDDIMTLIRSCVYYRVYKESMRNLLKTEGMNVEEADKMLFIISRISGYDPERFNLAVVALNKALDRPKKAYYDLLNFLEKCNPADYIRDMQEICDSAFTVTRKILTSKTTAKDTCKICGKVKCLSEMEFGRPVCRECRNIKAQSEDSNVSIKNIKQQAYESKEQSLKIIKQFESGQTTEDSQSSDDAERSRRIDKINELRNSYSRMCTAMMSKLDDPNIDRKLRLMEITNNMIEEAFVK